MALNAEGLNLKQKRPFHRRAQTVYWPYLTNVEHLGNIWGTHPISVDRKGIYDLVGIKQTYWKVTGY